MATIPFRPTTRSYEARKLQEVFRPCEVPSRDNLATADPSVACAPETARTRRFRRELENIDVSAIVFFLAGLVTIVLVAVLFL